MPHYKFISYCLIVYLVYIYLMRLLNNLDPKFYSKAMRV